MLLRSTNIHDALLLPDTAILVSVVVDLSGSVLPKALKICLCVGSVLSCLNYGVYACRLERVDFSVAS